MHPHQLGVYWLSAQDGICSGGDKSIEAGDAQAGLGGEAALQQALVCGGEVRAADEPALDPQAEHAFEGEGGAGIELVFEGKVEDAGADSAAGDAEWQDLQLLDEAARGERGHGARLEAFGTEHGAAPLHAERSGDVTLVEAGLLQPIVCNRVTYKS